MIRFQLSRPTPSLNTTLRQHWATGRKARRALAWEIWALLAAQNWNPLERAQVRVIRYSTRTLDHDNAVGGCKMLLDVLKLPHVKTNPTGLGVIAGDEPHRLRLVVEQVRVKTRAEQCTVVEITEWVGG